MNNQKYKIIFSSDPSIKQLKLTIILACFGEISLIKDPLERTMDDLYHMKDHMMLKIITDSIQLSELPVILKAKHMFPHIQIIHLNQEAHQPAKLMNVAFDYIHTPYVSFSWAGSRVHRIIHDFAKDTIMGDPVYTINNNSINKVCFDPPTPLIHGWLQCTKLYELNDLIVSYNAIKLLGQFDESPILQKDFDWEWMLRLSRYFIFKPLGSTSNNNILTFKNYPFTKLFKYDNDIIHRYVLRNRPLPYKNASKPSTIEISFLKDLPSIDVEKIKKRIYSQK